MSTIDVQRKASLPTLVSALKDQLHRSVDIVAPASKIRAHNGSIVVEGVPPIVEPARMDADGVTPERVTPVDGVYRCTRIADEGISGKLSVPRAFLAEARDVPWIPAAGTTVSDRQGGGITLYDHTVNALLADASVRGPRWAARNDGKRAKGEPMFMLRTLRHPDGDPTAAGDDGIVRAFLSNSYRTIDSYDVLLAVLDGLRQAGEDTNSVEVDGDLTDKRMILRVRSTRLAALAPKLLENYRSPFGGHDVGAGWTPERVANAAAHEGSNYAPGTEPVVFAGFVVTNSEVGYGAFDIRPRLSVRVCRNGLTINAEAERRIHVGGRLEEGAVRWSENTERKNLELITAKTADAVRTWMSPEYLAETVDAIEREAGAPISDAPKVIEAVSRKLKFSEAQAASILDMFIAGGDMTASGVMHAVTASAQVQDDGEDALAMEMAALDAMAFAAKV